MKSNDWNVITHTHTQKFHSICIIRSKWRYIHIFARRRPQTKVIFDCLRLLLRCCQNIDTISFKFFLSTVWEWHTTSDLKTASVTHRLSRQFYTGWRYVSKSSRYSFDDKRGNSLILFYSPKLETRSCDDEKNFYDQIKNSLRLLAICMCVCVVCLFRPT